MVRIVQRAIESRQAKLNKKHGKSLYLTCKVEWMSSSVQLLCREF